MNRSHPSRLPPALIAALVVAGACLGLPATAAHAGQDDHVAAREALRRGEILPLNDILEIVRRRVPGDVIEVDLDRDDNAWEYEIKVLTSTGRVREVKLNARNGAILEIEDD